jgi:hypothetical protein
MLTRSRFIGSSACLETWGEEGAGVGEEVDGDRGVGVGGAGVELFCTEGLAASPTGVVKPGVAVKRAILAARRAIADWGKFEMLVISTFTRLNQ